MSIEVKGTKTTSGNVDPAERYALKDIGQLSAVPKVVGLALVGVALYLKSIFPAFAKKDSENKGGSGEGDTVTLSPEEPLLPGSGQGSGADTAKASADKPESESDPAEQSQAPASLAVIRLTDISHRTGQFTLDSIAVVVQPDIGGPFKSAIISNDIGPPQITGRLEKLPSLGSSIKDTQRPDSEADEDETEDDSSLDPDDRERPAPNRTPRVDGPVYLSDVVGASILSIALADLLRHAADPDGDQLSVTKLAVSSGTLTQSGSEWAYQATGDFTQPVVISYTITDGEFEVEQTAHLTAIRPWVQGTDGDDLLVGTVWSDDIIGDAGDDNIDGRAGDDVISGGDGDDHILAGDGDDTIFGGSGHDIILGQDGHDHLFGDAGDDRLYGGKGNDLLFGGEGDDLLDGGEGDDLLDGGMGDDTLYGGEGDNLLAGGSGDDELYGGAGNDRLDGGEGNDFLADGAGSDVLIGGVGDDTVMAATDSEDDWFFGGDGFDRLDYSNTTEGIVIDLVGEMATGDEIGSDRIESFEEVIGGAGNDHFIVGASPTILTGGAGDNIFEFIPASDPIQTVPVTHTIADFKHGDTIKMSHYKLFDKVFDRFEDEFEAMYGEDIDEDDIPIRVRHDAVEEVRRTIIEADFNLDEIFETTFLIQGHHVLMITEMTA